MNSRDPPFKKGGKHHENIKHDAMQKKRQECFSSNHSGKGAVKSDHLDLNTEHCQGQQTSILTICQQ